MILSSNGKYYTRLADREKELLPIFQLRYKIFVEELGEGQPNPEKIEKDEFDEYCEYILLIEKKTESIVGLYRVLPYYHTHPKVQYYSNIEFDLTPLLDDPKYRDHMAELGRLGILKDHRGGANLETLWTGLVNYCKQHDIQYLIGCGSLQAGITRTEVATIYRSLVKQGKVVFEPDIKPRRPSEIHKICQDILHRDIPKHLLRIDDSIIDYDAEPYDDSLRSSQIPRLLKRYLRVGARFLGPPSYDAFDFGCYDFFIMINLRQLKPQAVYYFLKLKLFWLRILNRFK